MKSWKIYCLVAAVLLSSAIALLNVKKIWGPMEYSSRQSTYLSEELRRDYKKRALEGDVNSAVSLYQYYLEHEEDFVEAKKWRIVAEKNGAQGLSVEMMKTLDREIEKSRK